MALLAGVRLLAIWREAAAFLVMRRVGMHRSFSLTTAAQLIASKLTPTACGQNRRGFQGHRVVAMPFRSTHLKPAAIRPLRGHDAVARGCWSGADAWRRGRRRSPGARWPRRFPRALG